jgi:hypothetical protein
MKPATPIFLAPADEQARRQAVCDACPEKKQHPVARAAYCGKCGCFIAGKTRLKRSTCPLNKW